MKYKKIKKLLAAMIAFLLIGLMLLFVNSFTGNPLSAAYATYKIRSYVQTTYPELELKIPKASYNFKFSDYYSVVKSQTSEDTYFAISWRNGAIHDSYEYEVANKFTTYRRISMEFNTAIEAIIEKEFPYTTTIVIGDFAKKDDDFSSLIPNMTLDITKPPIPTYLTIYITSKEVSYEVLSQCLIEVYDLMAKHNIPIDIYSMVLEKLTPEGEKSFVNGDSIYLYDFPSEKIADSNLIEVMKTHQKQMEQESEKK